MNFFIAGPMGVMIPIMARDILQGSAFVLACLQISLGIGFILGALTTSLCKTFVRPGLVMLCFMVVVVLGYTALGFIHQFALAICALLQSVTRFNLQILQFLHIFRRRQSLICWVR